MSTKKKPKENKYKMHGIHIYRIDHHIVIEGITV